MEKHEMDDITIDLPQPFTRGLQKRDVLSSISTARGSPEHEVVDEQSLDEQLTSLRCHRCGVDTLAKDTKREKGIIGSQPRRSRNVFIHHPKDPIYEVLTK